MMKEIPGWEGIYAAMDDGRIYSMPRTQIQNDGRVYTYRGRFLRPSPGKHGHLRVALARPGSRPRTFCVHALVALAFHGPRPDGLQVRHKNGNAGSNAPSNLTYGTQTQNNHDRFTHGTSNRGTERGFHILHAPQVAEIKGRLGLESQSALARRFGVHRSTIAAIAQGRNWAYVRSA